MFVRATAHVRNEDMRRILKKQECEPGDEFELEPALAEVYLNNDWVVPAQAPTGKFKSDEKQPEFAARTGAPEQALSPRGRGGMRTKPPETA